MARKKNKSTRSTVKGKGKSASRSASRASSPKASPKSSPKAPQLPVPQTPAPPAPAPAPKKSGFTVAGKSISDLIRTGSQHLNRLKEENLRKVVTRLSSAANKRADRMEKSGESSPALDARAQSGGRFSAKGKFGEALKNEFLRVKQFLQDPTSSLKGWNQRKKDALKEAKERGVIKTDEPGGAGPVPPKPGPQEQAREEFRDAVTPGPEPGPELGADIVPSEEPEDQARHPIEWDDWTLKDDGSWEHPVFGPSFELVTDETGTYMVNSITGEIVGFNKAREYHDYDVTRDNRLVISPDGTTSTETGELWRMVDSIARMDSRFAAGAPGSYRTGRMALFDALDQMWSGNPGMTFEQARDAMMQHLDQIYEGNLNFLEASRSAGTSSFTLTDEEASYFS